MFLFFLFNLSTNKYLIFHKMQNSFFSINKIFFAIFFSTIFSNQIHVNLNDPIYTFLERMYNQNQISNYNKSTMPFTKKFIIKNLNQINKNELNLIDKQLLNEYLADYDINITNHNFFKLDKSIYHPFQSKSKMLKGMKDLVIFTPNQPKNHLIIFNNNKKQLLFDIGFNTKFEMKETQTRIIYNYNYSLSIFLNKKIIIHSDANLFSMVYNSQYSEYPDQFKGGFPNYHKGFYGYETEMAFEYSNSYIQYDSEIGNFSFKKEAVIWGNGKQPIILSNNSPPITMLNWKTNLDFTINTLSSKFPKYLVQLALLSVTFFELVGGFSSLFGIVEICMGTNSLFWSKIGIYSSALALLILLTGQRISMNYEDAKTIVIYFLVCIAGMMMVN